MRNKESLKFFELFKINQDIKSLKYDLSKIQQEVLYDGSADYAMEKAKLEEFIKSLETSQEKLNEELVNSEAMTEFIKMRYALLLSNYAAHHDNPTSKPKREIKALFGRLLDFKKL